MKVCAIVPLRARRDGKTRLAPVLPPESRAQLIDSMLQDVLAAVRGAQRIDRVVLVTHDRDLAPPGVEVVHDAGDDLNAALQLALEYIGSSADAALVIAADAPAVTARELDRLVERADEYDVAVVPDQRGSGTNALWLRLPRRIEPAFGADSADLHARAARQAGARFLRLELPGLARDFDLPEDLPDLPLSARHALDLASATDLPALMSAAAAVAERGFGRRIGYSRKVFIPLTHLCRDVCHYCTFAAPPRPGARAFMPLDEVLAIARAGAAAGCREALFTLGDKPELRYAAARNELRAMGFATTLEYLEHCARAVFEQTGLLPHLNPGVLEPADLARLRRVSVSMGLMLETTAARLAEHGGPHHRSPDKLPALRLATLRAAGELQVPFTTGILIGIGETRLERIEALLAIRELHARHGHIQEVIIQNFRAKPGTRMAQHPEPTLEDLQWTIAVARLILGASMSIQVPPNLSAGLLPALVAAGLNDWGGVSPVTPDHVNPEAPWPQLAALERDTLAAGRQLVERLAIVPSMALDPDRWLDPALRPAVLRQVDALGYVRDSDWHAGCGTPPPRAAIARGAGLEASAATLRSIERARAGDRLSERELAALFAADGADVAALVGAADALRREVVGDAVTYVVNRNINYTNICTYSCGFCAFAKGRGARTLRGPGYRLELEEIGRRVAEAADRGATEVCLQGGIHPRYTGETYLSIVQAARRAAPAMHVHAFSPLEISHGASTLGLSLGAYLTELHAAGLRTLPGTAAEILSDDIRALICADKLTTAEWLEVMRAAHGVGIRSTATIMFGHLERYEHWARHLLAIRDLQAETGGFTEFVPLPFVHMEAPLWRAGRTRSGPTWREALLMHSVARLALHPLIPNVQASWVKMGREGVLEALAAGANDLGGVLMDESITRAAGGVNGQEMTAETMRESIRSIGREPRERTTLYGRPAEPQRSLGTTSLPMMSSASIGLS